MNEYLPVEIVEIHRALTDAAIPHAFGGAIALAYWGTPRYTHDVDINIALPADQHRRVLDALSALFPIRDRDKAERELTNISQTRLRWDALPVDLFCANTPFHEAMAIRTREVDYAGTPIPVISAEDLIICKSLFDRPKDWVDINNIFKVQQTLDEQYLHHWLHEFSEPEDERVTRIEELIRDQHGGDLSAGGTG